jgi:hypothetical protein
VGTGTSETLVRIVPVVQWLPSDWFGGQKFSLPFPESVMKEVGMPVYRDTGGILAEESIP